jgi:TP901 family phage tail tape measure protein
MTANAEGSVDIVLDANGAPVMKAIDNALARMKDIQRITSTIVENAKKASLEFNKATNSQLKGFEKALARVESLEKAMQRLGRQPINQANSDRLFAGQIANVAKFNIGLKDAATAAQAFQGRLNDMDRRLVQMGNSGNVSGGLLSRRLGLEQAQKDFIGVQREMERVDRAARRAGITADKSGYINAETALFGALRNQKVNLGPELAQLNRAADEYIAAVKAEQARIRKAAAEGAAPVNPVTPTPKGKPSLFGATGLAGVVTRTAAYGGAAAAIFGAISTFKTGIDEAIKFDDTLHQISGVAGLTATQMAELGDTIQGVAEHSKFARQEIAEASVVLAQAGFSADDISKSLEAINNLAAASGSSFKEVTDVMTSAIGAFQLNAQGATQIADQLTAALNMTKLNIQQVALGIQYAGAAAYENNMTFQDLTATFAALAQAGIRSGSTMGTGVRQLLTDLLTPSKKMVEEMKKVGLTMDDINVKTLGLMGVIKKMSESGFTAGSAFKGLEVRAAAAYLALVNQQDVALKVAQAQTLMRGSTDAAAKATGSLAAQWQIYKNQLNNTFTDQMGPVARFFTNILKWSNDLIPKRREMAGVEAQLTEKYKGQADAQEKVFAGMEEYRMNRETLLTQEQQFADAIEATNTANNRAHDIFEKESQILDSVNTALTRVSVKKQILMHDSVALATETVNLENQFQGLAAMLGNTALSYDSLTAALLRYQSAQLGQKMAAATQMVNTEDANIRQGALKGQTYLNDIRQSGLMGHLPKDIQDAILRAAGSQGVSRTSAIAMVQDFMGGKRGASLNPNERRMLSGFASGTGFLELSLQGRANAVLERDTAGRLLGSEGQKLMGDIQGISSVAGGRKVMKDLTRRMNGAKTAASKNALGQLLMMASQKTNMIEPPSPPDVKAKKAKSGVAAEHAQDRRNLDIAKEALKASESDLSNSIKDVAKYPQGGVSDDNGAITITKGEDHLTSGRLKKNLDEVSDKLDQWVADRMKLAAAQIDRDDMGGLDAAHFMEQVKREIAEKKETTARETAEALGKALDVMVKATEDVAALAQQKIDQELAMSEARLKSLDRASARGAFVPDYVRNHYERLQAGAQDKHDRSQIDINNTQIAGLTSDLKVFQDASDQFAVDHPGMAKQLSPFYDKVRDIRREIAGLSNDNATLKASFQDLIPQDLGTSMDMMLEQWKEAHGLNMTLNQDLTDMAGKGLDAAYQAMTGFFTDIISGAKSVKAAFGDMVKGILQAMEQLVAEFIAKKIFQFILSALGGGDPGADSIGYIWNGGEAVKGAWGGEHIQGPVEGRDSVHRMLAPGEFVMRKAAVRSVGVANMRKINEMGANALQAHGMPQAAPVNQQVAVYVVKEDQKPQMGPKDVLVAVHDDILKNGQTKKLIKLVSQGG